jgi:hypothetical protein
MLQPNPAIKHLEVLVCGCEMEGPLSQGQCARVTLEWLEGGALFWSPDRRGMGPTSEKQFGDMPEGNSLFAP